MLGDRKQALTYLDRSLQLDPSNKELLFNAAEVYNQLHETGLRWSGWGRLWPPAIRVCGCHTAALDNLHGNPRYQALMQQK